MALKSFFITDFIRSEWEGEWGDFVVVKFHADDYSCNKTLQRMFAKHHKEFVFSNKNPYCSLQISMAEAAELGIDVIRTLENQTDKNNKMQNDLLNLLKKEYGNK